MSLNPVNNVGMSPAVVAAAAAALPLPHQAMSLTSLLGMSADEIAKQMRSGKSLDDIARSKNVSHADLVAAIKANGPRELKPSPSTDRVADQSARPAERVATTDRLPTGGTHHHGNGVGRQPGSTTHGVGDKDESSPAPGLQTPAQRNQPGAPSSKLARDVGDTHPQDPAGLEALIKRAGIDPTALGGGTPKGLIIDTTA